MMERHEIIGLMAARFGQESRVGRRPGLKRNRGHFCVSEFSSYSMP